ncbi:hypothetical protein PABG_04191 [Paracoccidioides brasiliensis Pb03]|nr:hypothetical protein PABG_04191 [Paracoccidioides brasiliensis Pb03]
MLPIKLGTVGDSRRSHSKRSDWPPPRDPLPPRRHRPFPHPTSESPRLVPVWKSILGFGLAKAPTFGTLSSHPYAATLDLIPSSRPSGESLSPAATSSPRLLHDNLAPQRGHPSLLVPAEYSVVVILCLIRSIPLADRQRGALEDGIMGKAAVTGTGKGKLCDASPLEGARSNSRSLGPPPSGASTAPQPRASNSAARSAPSKPQEGSKSFEFVLVTDTESRRQVRRHAMRQYMRQRRLEGIARLESSRAQVRGWGRSGSPATGTNLSSSSSRIEELDDDENITDLRSSSSDSSRGSVGPAEPDIPIMRDDENLTNQGDEIISALLHDIYSSDPKAMPGAGCFDPFNSYPLKLNRTDQHLIHHFVTTYPMMMYKMGDAHQNNPIKDIFRHLTLHDPTPFQAMLAISSKHLAGVEGHNESVQSLTHKMRALRMLNERLQSDAGRKHDGTIYAAATMAVIEKWSKDRDVERMHIQGIEQLLRRRGGMSGMRATSPFLENVLYWVDLSCAPRAIVAASLPWTGDIPDTVPSTLPYLSPKLHIHLTPHHHVLGTDPQEIAGILQACEDFLAFFRSLNALQHSLISTSLPVPLDLNHEVQAFRSQKRNLFDASTTLFSILTTLPDYDHGIRDVRFIDEYTCMACLFYLNTALYDSYLKSQNFDHYLEWVNLELKEINPYSNPSISSLLWVFMGNGGFMANRPSDKGERSWFVSRMVRVAKRLEWKQHGTLWDNLRDTLLGFLTTQQECGIGSDQVGEAEIVSRKNCPGLLWDEDEMRKHILGPLYTGLPTFSMSPSYESSSYTLEPLTTAGDIKPPTFEFP